MTFLNSSINNLALPIEQDENGILLVRMSINNIITKAAVDTGSANTIINFPRNLSKVRSIQHANLLEFGSQSSIVEWKLANCVFTGTDMCSANEGVTRSVTMYVGHIIESQGTTRYNILGLGRCFGKYDTLQMMGVLSFTIVRQKSRIWLILNSTKLPTDVVPVLHCTETPYLYNIIARSVNLGNQVVAQNVRVSVDIGSNFTTLPTNMFKRCVKILEDTDAAESCPGFKFVFFCTNGAYLELRCPKNVYIHKERMLFDESNHDTITLGSLFLRFCSRITFSPSYIGFATN